MAAVQFLIVISALVVLCQGQFSALVDKCAASTENCVYGPKDCMPKNDATPCSILSFIETEGEDWVFSIGGTSDFQYIAIGFSDDNRMGEEVTVDCIVGSNGTIYAVAGSDTHHSHTIVEGVKSVINVPVKIEDNSVVCKFKIAQNLEVETYSANVTEGSEYFLLLAAGKMQDGLPQRHTIYAVSDSKYKFHIENGASSMSITASTFAFALALLFKYSH